MPGVTRLPSSAWGRHRDAQSLRCLEIDHQLILGRRLHRQVGRLLAFEDTSDVSRGSPVLVEEIRPLGDQSPGIGIIALLIYRGRLVAGCKRDDQITMDR